MSNQLLSITEAAVRLGVSPNVVVYHVGKGDLASLDEERLVARGLSDVPVIRESELERLRSAWEELRAADGDSNVIYPKAMDGHQGLVTASLFLMALQDKDAEGAFTLSSRASQGHFSKPSALLRWWREYLGGGTGLYSTGIARAVYQLSDHDAIAVRFVSDRAPTGVTRRHQTIDPVATPVALVDEEGKWKVDHGLQEEQAEWQAQAGIAVDPPPVP